MFYQLLYVAWLRVVRNSGHNISYSFIFFLLCACERLYCLLFYINSHLRSLSFSSPVMLPTISVGNIVCGGVGKSVFISSIIHALDGTLRGVILLRGYRGMRESTGGLVADGYGNTFMSVLQAGDEAIMHAFQNPSAIVAVGKNRAKILRKVMYLYDCDYVVLDDAYQHRGLLRNLDILLIDVRAPFDNGHCLPAGKLREKDVSRANIIIFTHAAGKSLFETRMLKEKIRLQGFKGSFFSGIHQLKGILNVNFAPVPIEKIGHKVFIFAGIGEFAGFRSLVANLGFHIVNEVCFPNHHGYNKADIVKIFAKAENSGAFSCITTLKDLVKVRTIWSEVTTMPLFALEVAFSFISQSEFKQFCTIMSQTVNYHYKHYAVSCGS